MKHLFIPYELALLAKEKGFDESCFTNYMPNGTIDKDLINSLSDTGLKNSKNKPVVYAPLYQQIIDWLREKHNKVISVSRSVTNDNGFVYSLENGFTFVECGDTDEYYQAFDKAIEKALNLI